MAWRPDYPVTLPDGRLVCGPHGLVICGYCTVDYSFMDEILAEDDDDDSEASDLGSHTDDIDRPRVDYSYMDEVLMEEDDDDSEASDLDDHTDEIDGPPLVVIGAPSSRGEPRVGTGRVFPTKFNSQTQATRRRRFSHSAKLTTPRRLCIGSFVATMKPNS
jgi:ribonuclease HI